MLDYLHSISWFQWLCFLIAAGLIFWPYFAPLVSGQPLQKRSSVLDDVLNVRRHLTDEEKALEAMDTIIIPAVMRKESS